MLNRVESVNDNSDYIDSLRKSLPAYLVGIEGEICRSIEGAPVENAGGWKAMLKSALTTGLVSRASGNL